MIKIKSILLVFLILNSFQLCAQVELVSDINKNPEANNGTWYVFQYKDALYYSMDDGVHGIELWKYKMGEAPSMVFDFAQGPEPTQIQFMTIYRDTLYFSAHCYSCTPQAQLYKYDGLHTPVMIDREAYGSEPYFLNVYKDSLYYITFNFNGGQYGLWNYIEPGLAKNIYTTGSLYPSDMVGFNDALYFMTNDGNGTLIHKYDKTISVVASVPGLKVNGESPVIFNGSMYFVATDEIHGTELWKYDGVNPPLLLDLLPGAAGSYPNAAMCELNHRLYFFAYDKNLGYELWSYDGISSPSIVADINPHYEEQHFARSMVVYKNTLFFQTTDGKNGFELWKYDGIHSPVMAADIQSGPGHSFPFDLTVFKGMLYFSASDGVHGRELMRYSGN
jgi:ELWxxDGT repeat protein